MIVKYTCEECPFQVTFDLSKGYEGSFEKSFMYDNYYVCPECQHHTLKRIEKKDGN